MTDQPSPITDLREVMLATIIGTMAYQAIENTMNYKPSLIERIKQYLSIFPFNNISITDI